VPDVEYTPHESTFPHSPKAKPQVGEIDHKWVKLKSDKGWRSRKRGEVLEVFAYSVFESFCSFIEDVLKQP